MYVVAWYTREIGLYDQGRKKVKMKNIFMSIRASEFPCSRTKAKDVCMGLDKKLLGFNHVVDGREILVKNLQRYVSILLYNFFTFKGLKINLRCFRVDPKHFNE